MGELLQYPSPVEYDFLWVRLPFAHGIESREASARGNWAEVGVFVHVQAQDRRGSKLKGLGVLYRHHNQLAYRLGLGSRSASDRSTAARRDASKSSHLSRLVPSFPSRSFACALREASFARVEV